jgi:hypothetical protein
MGYVGANRINIVRTQLYGPYLLRPTKTLVHCNRANMGVLCMIRITFSTQHQQVTMRIICNLVGLDKLYFPKDFINVLLLSGWKCCAYHITHPCSRGCIVPEFWHKLPLALYPCTRPVRNLGRVQQAEQVVPYHRVSMVSPTVFLILAF